MADRLSDLYQDLLDGTYDCVDRIVLNAYFRPGHSPGGFRTWWRRLTGSDDGLDTAHLMRLAGRFSRRVRAYAKANRIPVVVCGVGEHKHELAEQHLATTRVTDGVFLIIVGRAQAPVWEVSGKHHLERKRPMPYVNHYSFHILDREWGHITIKVSGHPPFPAQCIFNGHEWVACQARQQRIRFAKEGNCFTDISEIAGLARIADTLSDARTIGRLREVCERWIYSACLCFALDLDEQCRSGFRYQYSTYQLEYCRNVVFRRHFPIHKIFERSCELGVFRLTADVITQIVGVRKPKRLRGKLHTMLEKVDHGHHVLRIYCKSLVARMYEKFGTFLRIEICVNRVKDLGLNKGLEHLPALRRKLVAITDRLAGVEADLLNVHVDFPVFERLAKPVAAGRTKIPGIKIQDTRMLRLMEVLLQGGSQFAGWRTAQMHRATLEAFGITPDAYSLTQLRYDVRKLRAHGIVEREGRSYCYRLTDKGVKVAALFVLFQKRVCGPVANTLFHHRPTKTATPPAKIEAAYHKADVAIQKLVDLVAA